MEGQKEKKKKGGEKGENIKRKHREERVGQKKREGGDEGKLLHIFLSSASFL